MISKSKIKNLNKNEFNINATSAWRNRISFVFDSPFFVDNCNILFFNIKAPAKETKGKSEAS